MDCEKIKASFEELWDQPSDSLLGAEAKRHFEKCAACLARYEEFQSFSRAISSLPYFSPRLGFTDKVLAALNIQNAPEALPSWLAWMMGGAISLVFSWMMGILFLARERFSWNKTLGAMKLLQNPQKMRVFFQLRLARAPLLAERILRTFHAFNFFMGHWNADWFAQLPVAAVIAGIFIEVILRPSPIGAQNRKWRTL